MGLPHLGIDLCVRSKSVDLFWAAVHHSRGFASLAWHAVQGIHPFYSPAEQDSPSGSNEGVVRGMGKCGTGGLCEEESFGEFNGEPGTGK